MRITPLLWVALLLGCRPVAALDDASSPAQVGSVLSENLLGRAGFMRYGDHGLHYAEAGAAMGALRFAQATGDEALVSRLAGRYGVLLDPGADLVSDEPHVDFRVIGIVPLQVRLCGGGEEWLARGLALADAQWQNPREDGLTPETRWWIDDLYMVGALQAQAFRATGDSLYADRAARFALAYVRKLQQPNGLFHHGPDAPFHWGRGNGWVAAGIAETLDVLPAGHPARDELLVVYRRMMDVLLAHQAPSGMWRQLVDMPESWEESSCTAMFAYAMQVGLRHDWLPAEGYKDAVARAWRALLRHVDDAGNLQEICVGTGQSRDVQYYLDRPRHAGDFHGQAPLLWLTGEMVEVGREEVVGDE